MEETDSTGNQRPREEMMVEISVKVSTRTKIRAFLVPKDIPEEERQSKEKEQIKHSTQWANMCVCTCVTHTSMSYICKSLAHN